MPKFGGDRNPDDYYFHLCNGVKLQLLTACKMPSTWLQNPNTVFAVTLAEYQKRISQFVDRITKQKEDYALLYFTVVVGDDKTKEKYFFTKMFPNYISPKSAKNADLIIFKGITDFDDLVSYLGRTFNANLVLGRDRPNEEGKIPMSCKILSFADSITKDIPAQSTPNIPVNTAKKICKICKKEVQENKYAEHLESGCSKYI